jgi:polar amino acid transport system substrate-binding protein
MRRLALALAAVALAMFVASAVAATPPQTLTPGQLTVGVSLPSEGFQVGVVRGDRVLYAQGLEIDLARALASKLGLRPTVFVQSRFDRLLTPGAKPWDLAVAEITITDARRSAIDFSTPYMTVDQGVLLAQTVRAQPRTIAALRPLRLCALRKTTGAELAKRTIAPSKPVLLVGNVPSLMLDLQTGRCDAVVYDAPALGTLKARAPARYGAFAGIIETREQYGIAFPRGSALVGPVNRALAALTADGTIARLEKKWLTVRLGNLPVLR